MGGDRTVDLVRAFCLGVMFVIVIYTFMDMLEL